MESVEALGAGICGISVDSVERIAGFAGRYRLPYPLLSDRGGRVAARYGSLRNFWLIRFARRNTFVIDPAGRIAGVHLGVRPAQSVTGVLPDLRNLVGERAVK